jgi:tryptophan synthase beta subunit
MQYSPEVFGTDYYEFRPQRWMDDAKLNRAFIAFARGTRNCIGLGNAFLPEASIAHVCVSQKGYGTQIDGQNVSNIATQIRCLLRTARPYVADVRDNA